MSLAAGTRLGHYEVLGLVGAGGMGEVYKARDTHLDRHVALKILPPDRVADAGWHARFVQEARAASALNHSNIVTVHDIDSADGVHFIAMEYVDGETLDRLIRRRGLPVKQAVDYAIQIADGLEKAHAAGIVHRDLKPSNILVTGDGRVKILDFGLAKVVERPAEAEAAATRTTAGPPLTEHGQIVGTIAYMSPEQVAGGVLDTRSDIFSFGIVLYEMVTGRRPFDGESDSSTLQAILAKEPIPPSDVVGALPFELERAVLRCLRKDARRRWQTMADVKVALEELKDDLEAGRVSQVTVAAVWPHRRWRLLVAAAAVALVVAAVAVAWWLLRAPPQTATLGLERLTFEGSAVVPPAISADGRLMAYASARDGRFSLYVQQLGARQPIRLTQHESNDWFPSFSPDGLKLVYRSERDGGGLFTIDTLGGPGGAELRLADGGHYPSYSPDGATIAYIVPDALARSGRVFLIAAGGGGPRRVGSDVVAVRADGIHEVPLWSPDGGSILFHGMRLGEPATRGWWIAPAAGGEVVPVSGAPPEPNWGGRFAVAWRGEFIYYVEAEPLSGSTLYRLRVASRPWRMTGAPEKLASPAGLQSGGSTSRDGRMVFTSMTPTTNIWSAAILTDKVTAGPLGRVTADAMAKRHLTAAADGSTLAYVTHTYSGQRNAEIRIRDLGTGRESLVAGSGNWPFLDPVLSRDGSRIAYTDVPEDKVIGYVGETSGSSRAFCEGCFVHGLFGDPPVALVRSGSRLVRQPLEGGGASVIMDVPSVREFAVSPSGKWLAFTQSRQDGRAALHLAELSHGASTPDRWRLLADDSRYLGSPAWSTDGTVLYYLSQRDGFECVWAQRIMADGATAGAAVPALHLHPGHPTFSGYHNIAVTSDRVFVVVTDVTGDIWSVKLHP